MCLCFGIYILLMKALVLVMKLMPHFINKTFDC